MMKEAAFLEIPVNSKDIRNITSVSSSSTQVIFIIWIKKNMILTFLWDSSPWIDLKQSQRRLLLNIKRMGWVIHGYLTIPLEPLEKFTNGSSSPPNVQDI